MRSPAPAWPRPRRGRSRSRIPSSAPGHLPPRGEGTEQARTPHGIDIRSDIYSLGCSCYHMIAGVVPFPDATTAGKLMAHREVEAEPLASLAPSCPPGLAVVVRRMMRKSPDERYARPSEVASALEPFASGPGPLSRIVAMEMGPREGAASAIDGAYAAEWFDSDSELDRRHGRGCDGTAARAGPSRMSSSGSTTSRGSPCRRPLRPISPRAARGGGAAPGLSRRPWPWSLRSWRSPWPSASGPRPRKGRRPSPDQGVFGDPPGRIGPAPMSVLPSSLPPSSTPLLPTE